jgi:uncharacterized membrane protein
MVSRAALDSVNTTTIDFPGAIFTEVNGININGDVVGRYILTPGGISHGFMRDSAGSFTTIDVPDSPFTTPKGIAADGRIVGLFVSPGGNPTTGPHHGFLFSGGAFTQIDFSDTTGTFPAGIDSEGNIVGAYCDLPCSPLNLPARDLHGFFLSDGHFEAFDVPGSTSTALVHTSRVGGSVGLYKDTNDVPHGFVLSNCGRVSTIDVPGAVGTWGLGINASGDVVGSWCDQNPCTLAQTNNHSFKLGKNGFELFDPIGNPTSRAWDINDLSEVAGASKDPLGVNHGYIYPAQ